MKLTPALLLSGLALAAQQPPLYVGANLSGPVAVLDPEGPILFTAVAGVESPSYRPPCPAGASCPARQVDAPSLYLAALDRSGAAPIFELTFEAPQALAARALIPLRQGGRFLAADALDGQFLFRLNPDRSLAWTASLDAGEATISYLERSNGEIVYSGYDYSEYDPTDPASDPTAARIWFE